MPTPTYDLIEEKVLSSAAPSVTFNSIPGTYKDLVLEVTGFGVSNQFFLWRVSNDSGSNYSRTYMLGNGTTASSSRDSNIAQGYAEFGTSSTALGTASVQFMSYANTNVNKTVLTRGGDAGTNTVAGVYLWRSTAAINRIDVLGNGGTNIGSGTTLRLWGV